MSNKRLRSDSIEDLRRTWSWRHELTVKRCTWGSNEERNANRFLFSMLFHPRVLPGLIKDMIIEPILLPAGSTKDRISDLPDPILFHILSFLPTKLTVVTSVLSKRWKTLYHYVPSFNMFNPYLSSHHLWSALQCRDVNSPILLFRLLSNKPEVFNPLIISAIQRGIETLELNLLLTPLEMKPLSNILSCNTLTVLKLSNLCYNGKHLPQINISSIKTLHLNTVIFAHTMCMINFFLSFPILQELQTNDVKFLIGKKILPKKRGIIKCLLNLVRANISDIELIPFFRFSRALILHIKKVPLISIVQLPIFYNLTQLELSFYFDQTWPKKWEWVLKVLQQSHKLQNLIISEDIENEHEMEINDMNRGDPLFEIQNEINEKEINEENWEHPQIVPACLSSELKTCLFRYYRGKSAELQFAEYVMRNSKVLLTMTIHTSSSIDLNTKYQNLQKLSLCPRNCEFIFD